MKQTVIIASAVAALLILTGILIILIHLSWTGITVNVTGSVELENSEGGIDLSMPQPVNLVATGPGDQPMPADLSIFRCPKCGGTMLPVHVNVLNGDIVWKCAECGYTINGNEDGKDQ